MPTSTLLLANKEEKLSASADHSIYFRLRQSQEQINQDQVAIEQIFLAISERITATLNEEEVELSKILKKLLASSEQFKKQLISELSSDKANSSKSRITALHYQNAFNDALNEKKSLAEKTGSITAFKNHARGSAISNHKRNKIGALVGALLTNITLFSVLAAMGAFALSAGPIGIALLVGMTALVATGFGIMIGISFAHDLAKNAQDQRGRDVSRDLKQLATFSNRFFQPAATSCQNDVAIKSKVSLGNRH